MRAGKVAVTLIVAVGLVLTSLVAWWLVRRSSTDRLHPLDSADQGGQWDDPKAAEPAGASERFPGRRELAGPAAPQGLTPAVLGAEQTVGSGHRVRVLEYEASLRVPADGTNEDLVVDAARVEVCAGNSSWRGGALAAAYQLAYPRPGGGFDLRPGGSGLVVKKPPLSTRLAGEPLDGGDCREGWVAFALGAPEGFDDRLPTAIVFDNSAFGFVASEGRGRAAWRILE